MDKKPSDDTTVTCNLTENKKYRLVEKISEAFNMGLKVEKVSIL